MPAAQSLLFALFPALADNLRSASAATVSCPLRTAASISSGRTQAVMNGV